MSNPFVDLAETHVRQMARLREALEAFDVEKRRADVKTAGQKEGGGRAISIEVARCPLCRHPAKADDYTERGTHLCTRQGCICPTGKDTTSAQRAAVRLRTAALAFARQPDEPADLNDTAGQRANRKLLNAAIAYADARKVVGSNG